MRNTRHIFTTPRHETAVLNRLKQKINRALLLCALFFYHCHSFAQEPYFNEASFNQDLPAEQVFSIYQDERGCLWLATSGGVCRFDGNMVRTFVVDDQLSSKSIFNFFEYRADQVWLNTGDNTLYFFNPLAPEIHFTSYKYNDTIRKIFYQDSRVEFIRKIWTDGKHLFVSFIYDSGYIKIGPSGEATIIGHNKNFYHYNDFDITLKIKNKSPGKTVFTEINPKAGNTGNQFYIFDSLSGNRQKTAEPLVFKERRSTGVVDYTFLGDTALFLIGPQCITLFDTICLINKLPSNATCLEVYENKDVLIGTYQGIYHFSLSGEFKGLYLENQTIHDLYTDREGGLWVGTSSEGLYYAKSLDYLTFPALLDHGKAPVNIQVDTNWFSLLSENQTLTVYNRSGKETGHFDNVNFFHKTFCASRNDLSEFLGEPHAFMHSGDYLYFGKKHNNDPLIVYPEFRSLFIITPDSCLVEKPDLSVINSCFIVNDSISLIATNSGVYQLTWFRSPQAFNLKRAFQNQPYTHITDFRDGYILSSPKGGLVFANDKHTVILNEQNGLLSNDVLSIENAGDSLIWVASTEGVSALKVNQQNTISVFHSTFETGINDSKIKSFTRFNDSIWVSTRKGVCIFSESEVLQKTKMNPAFFSIDSMLIDKKRILANSDTISIAYGQILDIYVNQLNLSSLKSSHYTYSSSDNPGVWSNADGENIQLICRTPGYTTLNIQSSHPVFENKALISLVIYTARPYWQQWWFYAFILIFLVIIIVIAVKISLRIQQKKRQRDVEKLKLEMKALVSQMNPHFTFNSINSIQAYIINNDRKDAVSYLSEFALLIRKTLEYSHKEFIFVAEEIEFLQLYTGLEKRRFDFEFDVNFSFNKPITESSFKLPPLLLQPILENAILHGISKKKSGPRSIYLKFTEHTDSLIVEIEDNGPGINFEAVTTHGRESFGIKILEQRLKIFNDVHYQPTDFEIQKLTDNLGTRVRIILRRNG